MDLDELVNPINKQKLDRDNIEYFFGIPNLYFGDEKSLTETQSEFYNDVKFPNYDDIDDFGTLLEKSSKSIFVKKLDDEIPFHSNILEAGCGTGQLSIALSRYNRKIHSIDLSKGSLIEAKKFIDKTDIKKRFVAVQVRFERKLERPVSLEKIKKNKKISHLALIKQSRLSVMPIDYKSWKIICNMGKV